MRPIGLVTIIFGLLGLSGCGYHRLGAATHKPPDVHTLAVPVFAINTETYRNETVMTQAVIREFAQRTRLCVVPSAETGAVPDAVSRSLCRL